MQKKGFYFRRGRETRPESILVYSEIPMFLFSLHFFCTTLRPLPQSLIPLLRPLPPHYVPVVPVFALPNLFSVVPAPAISHLFSDIPISSPCRSVPSFSFFCYASYTLGNVKRGRTPKLVPKFRGLR